MSPTRPDPDMIVGLNDIADRFGVTIHAVYRWKERSPHFVDATPFPDADGFVSNRPWYWWPTVEKWGRDTGRPKG